jgi:hypothetical protein
LQSAYTAQQHCHHVTYLQVEPNLPNLKVDVACFSAMMVSNYTIITKKTPIYTADKAAGFAHDTSNIHSLGEKHKNIHKPGMGHLHAAIITNLFYFFSMKFGFFIMFCLKPLPCGFHSFLAGAD